jgi:hypothetical protein
MTVRVKSDFAAFPFSPFPLFPSYTNRNSLMATAKKKQSTSPVAARLRKLFSWLFGPGRLALILVLLAALFVGGAYLAWVKLKPRILGSPAYRIGPEQVEVTPQPPWIQCDVREEVFRSPTLDGPLSLMDDDIVERIANGFARHPWVWKVERVAKQYGSIKVAIVYRKPVCMVKVRDGWVPVDVEAVLLPTGDFTPLETARYPHLLGVDREPTGLAGSRWADARVVGGAEIAAALGDAWEPMRLDHIEPLAADPTTTAQSDPSGPSRPDGFSGRSAEPFFTLVTRSGTRILWGYAPGANVLREPPAAEKVARLQHYFADKDTLDGLQGKPQELDVRKLPPAVRP